MCFIKEHANIHKFYNFLFGFQALEKHFIIKQWPMDEINLIFFLNENISVHEPKIALQKSLNEKKKAV